MRNLDYKKLVSEIQKWIKDYVANTNFDGVVMGISGGIDSAVTAALCVEALGKDQVLGLSLPCGSLKEDINDAHLLAEAINLQLLEFDLTNVYDTFLETVDSQIEADKVAKGNIRARLRMVAWYYVGQSKCNRLVVGTSNRTEIAIGYFTKYGDGAADFKPIGGLYKCEVREIAKILGIPRKIIEKPPSAGLWKGQTDEEEIGLSYDLLDEIIYHIDYNLNLEKFNDQDVKKVQKMMSSSEHKKTRAPIFKIR
ncbi:MAG: NH(3)-dependent NAD(+) synthetase [Promethearchaeota archaeon]|nr:MAG: NH(3)-dependent NAD(+) synthetase [Candidatus Lokiarchaeota archaeon]